MSKFDKAWFASGLSFACTQCGRCCHTSRQQEVFLNLAERQAAADSLKMTVDAFADRFLKSSSGRLKATDSHCVFLQKDKTCKIWSARPVQCRQFSLLHLI
eukprot:jgi/Ulvmu1/7048/UM033_0108.1